MSLRLGDRLDLSTGVAPSDLSVAASTGKRVFMGGVESVDIIVFKAAGTAGDDPTLTLRASTAKTAGTTADLPIITEYHLKNATALDGTQTWTKVTQAAAATIADPGGAGTSAESQQIVVIHVRAWDVPADKPYIQLNIGDVGANAQLGAVLYLVHKFDGLAAATDLPAANR